MRHLRYSLRQGRKRWPPVAFQMNRTDANNVAGPLALSIAGGRSREPGAWRSLLLPRLPRRLWSFLELAGAGTELFDLALEVGAGADMLFLQHAVGVDRERVG